VSELRARFAALDRGERIMLLVVATLVMVGLAMRLIDLGVRAMHHDESLHALFSYRFAQGNGYRHDPLMHGPFQFHVIALVHKLLGASDATSRIPAALFGTALIAVPLLLRRWLLPAGVVVASLLLAISPSLLYYSRFARGDMFMVVFALLLVTAIWRYRDDGRFRWLVLASLTLTLSFCTKETAYLTAAILLLYVNAVLTGVIVARRESTGWRRTREAILFFPIAWFVAIVWRNVAVRLRLGERPREADLIIVLGTITAPFLAAAVELPLQALGITLDADQELVLGAVMVTGLITVSAGVGLAWDARRWLVLGGLAHAITVLLFSTGFTNIDGIAGGYWNQLDYWIAQQEVRRGTQPLLYYFMMVPLYEFLALIPACIGGAWLVWRGNGLARLLAWWFLGTLLALSYAGEKMPWLTVHLALPLALLAALVAGRVLPALRDRLHATQPPAWLWATTGLAGALVALALVLTVRTGYEVSYVHPDTPVEPLIYTQTSPDVPALAREIDALAEARGGKSALPVIVDTTASLSWPWAWYLRDYTQASYAPDSVFLEGEDPIPDGAVAIIANSTLSRRDGLDEGFAEVIPFRHRWWFPEEGYRAITVQSVFEGLTDGSLLPDLVGFYLDRVDAATLGALEGSVLVPAS